MKVAELLNGQPTTLDADATVQEALALMARCGVRHLPVVRDGQVVGMLSDRDLLLATWNDDGSAGAPSPLASRYMSSPVLSISPDAYLDEAVDLMTQHEISALAVMRDSGLAGVITKSDLLNWFCRFAAENPAHAASTTLVSACLRATVFQVKACEQASVAVELMREARIQHLPVTEGHRLVGIISDRDVRRRLGMTVRLAGLNAPSRPMPDRMDPSDDSPPGSGGDASPNAAAGTALEESSVACEGRLARDLMTADPRTVLASDRLADAARIILDHRINGLPVVRPEGTLVGIIATTDITRLVGSLVAEAVALR